MKKTILMIVGLVGMVFMLVACGGEDEVIVFTNADAEAVAIMQRVVAEHFDGDVVFQTLGTGELTGRIAAEGTNIEAAVITLSSFHIDSNAELFADFDVKEGNLLGGTRIHSPLLALEGSLIVNTEVLAEAGLPMPQSIADLTDPVFANQISIPDLHSSTTGWLFVQAILYNYGEVEGGVILEAILENVGPHLETSGSAPIVKARSGEVAVAFGLRHQGVADMEGGLPIQVIDVTEGNFLLTESVALVDRGADITDGAREVARIIANYTRPYLLNYYPTALFTDESVSDADAARVRLFPEVLTVPLLEQHQSFFRDAQ